jgi:hypothetical protein
LIDVQFPTDNEWDIPLLDLEMQATHLHLPVHIYGYRGQRKAHGGTWLFYTTDFYFQRVWRDPSVVTKIEPTALSEPNFSVFGQTARAAALYETFRKRWLGRYWQSIGVPLFVDLNVSDAHADLNMIGVPHGWRAFVTRGYADRLDKLRLDYQIAHRWANGSPLFVVYAGGKAVKALCQQEGWIYVEDLNKRHADPDL